MTAALTLTFKKNDLIAAAMAEATRAWPDHEVIPESVHFTAGEGASFPGEAPGPGPWAKVEVAIRPRSGRTP